MSQSRIGSVIVVDVANDQSRDQMPVPHIKQVFLGTIAARGSDWRKHEMVELSKSKVGDFVTRCMDDASISPLCRDAVISLVAALIQYQTQA
jgi:hypothetical protein